MKQTKKQIFLENIESFSGKPIKEFATFLGCRVQTVKDYMSNFGVGCLTISEGLIQIDEAWSEINKLSHKDGNLIHNLRIAKSQAGALLRRRDEPDYIDNEGMSNNKIDLGSKTGGIHLMNTLDIFRNMAEESDKEVINDINRNGYVGCERIG